jgi:predicted small metal-binding protein
MSRLIDCPCGHQLRAEDDEGLFRAARQHIAQDHPDMQRSDEQVSAIIRERARDEQPVARLA